VLAAVNDLGCHMVDNEPPEPAINLSNRLNPNNVHFDKELASRCVGGHRVCVYVCVCPLCVSL